MQNGDDLQKKSKHAPRWSLTRWWTNVWVKLTSKKILPRAHLCVTAHFLKVFYFTYRKFALVGTSAFGSYFSEFFMEQKMSCYSHGDLMNLFLLHNIITQPSIPIRLSPIPQISTLNPQLSTLNHQPSSLNSQPSTFNPNSQPLAFVPQHSTLNPQFSAFNP